jgi:hypothetical protein
MQPKNNQTAAGACATTLWRAATLCAKELVLELTSTLWQAADQRVLPPTLMIPGVPPSVRRKAIDALRLHERATEEISICKRNMHALHRHLRGQENLCESVKTSLLAASDQVSLGKLTLVCQKSYRLCASISTLANLMNASDINEHLDHMDFIDAPEEVRDFRRGLDDEEEEEEGRGEETITEEVLES